MKFCEEVKKEQILKKAFNLIEESKKCIDTTMDAKEEINHPLPEIYHNKLYRLSKKRVAVNRYVFGTKKLFIVIKNKYPNVNTIYGGEMNKYQRMLIADKEKGLFAIGSKIFFTAFKPLIKSLLEYVKIY